MKKEKKILIITATYPFGYGEVFLNHEILILSKYFKQISIIAVNPTQVANNYINPTNVHCSYFKIKENKWFKLKCLLNLFNIKIIKELYSAIFNYKIRFSVKLIKLILIRFEKSLRIAKYLEENFDLKNVDILYSYWMDEKALALTHLNVKAKKISRAHGWDLYFERSEVEYLPFIKVIYKKFQQIHFISENGMNYFVQKHKIFDNHKLYISRLGTLKKENAINFNKINNEVVILSNSFVYPNKRIDLLVEAISLLNIEVKWIHIGAGYDMNYFNEIQNIAKKTLIKKSNIKYTFIGHLSNENVHDYILKNKIDLFINVSKSEGIPVSIMEAMSYGIPIIATEVGGVSEIVIHNVNGFLMDPNPSAIEITKRILEFVNLDERSKLKMRSESIEIWQNQYNAEKNYNNFYLNLNNE